MSFSKYKWALLNLSASLMILSCSKQIVQTISPQKKAVAIDGLAKEYNYFQTAESQSGLSYSLSNDKDNFYLCLKITDESLQHQILMAGMTVWLDTHAQTKEQIGILFPLSGSRPPIPPNRDPASRDQAGSAQKMREMLKAQKTLELVGFRNILNGPNVLQTTDGIKLQVNIDSTKSMIYELVVPFEHWYKSSISASDSNKIFSMSVQINALEMPSGPPKEFNGPPPGAGGMGDGPGMGAPFSGMTEKKNIQTRFKLHFDVH